VKEHRRSDVHALAGAYAMDAVTPEDRALFDDHLARCAACAQEVAELREATARLAGAVAAEPPAALIESTLAAAGRIRQLPPAARRGGRLRPVLLRPRAAVAAAVVLLAGAAALGTVTLRAEHQASAAGQQAGTDELRGVQIARVLTSPDAELMTARARTGGTVTVVVSRGQRALVFATDGLRPLPASRCYQLWLMGPSGDRSAGMLPAPRQRMTSPVIASGLSPGDRVGLTVEPDGGTAQPTTAPILLLTVAG
jgi:anti-sigma-K factor RskA